MTHTNEEIIKSAPAAVFQVHPEVIEVSKPKNLDCLRYLIKEFGQLTPVKVVETDGQLHIIDGVSRFHCMLALNIPSIIYQVVDVEPGKIIEYRMLSNSKTQRLFTETCLEAQRFLNLVGSSQGKKRELLGFEGFFDENNFGKVSKNKFQLVCAMMGIDFKASTLRKAMKIYDSTFKPGGKSKYGMLEKLDEGEITIDRAFKLLVEYELKEKRKQKSEQTRLSIAHSVYNSKDKPYKLFNKSSMNMDEIAEGSIDLIVDSHPYYGIREFPNQDNLRHGEESSLPEYIENFRKFNEEKYRVLRPGGVLVTVIGETYTNGYQGVCTEAERVLKQIGFIIIDQVVWVKSNQRYAPHKFRFQNTKENIIVAFKPGAEPHFTAVKRKGSSKDNLIKKSSTGLHYIPNEETSITNVITTCVYNWRELNSIDPDFHHEAPCVNTIYEIFIEAYSQPGDTILDGFIGTGTLGLGLKTGRKVIGYDVDNESLEFCRKRFDHYLNELVAETQLLAA
jgi:DNA modification methylase